MTAYSLAKKAGIPKPKAMVDPLKPRDLSKDYVSIEPLVTTFYAMYELNLILEEKGVDIGMKRYMKWFNSRLANLLFDYCALSCLGEARHAKSIASIHCESLPNSFSRHQIYNLYGAIDPIRSGKMLISVFNSIWVKDGFGGKKWAEIVETYTKYGSISDVLFIDRIINKQHNGGCLFNKPVFIKYHWGGTEYLKKLLDHRREHGIFKASPKFGFAFGSYVLPMYVTDECYKFIKKAESILDISHNIRPWPIGDTHHGIVYSEPYFPEPLKWGYIELEASPEKPMSEKDKVYKKQLKWLQEENDYEGCTCKDCVKTAYEEAHSKKEEDIYNAENNYEKWLEFLKANFSYCGCTCLDCVKSAYLKAITVEDIEPLEKLDPMDVLTPGGEEDYDSEDYEYDEEIEEESKEWKGESVSISPPKKEIYFKVLDNESEEVEQPLEFIDGQWK